MQGVGGADGDRAFGFEPSPVPMRAVAMSSLSRSIASAGAIPALPLAPASTLVETVRSEIAVYFGGAGAG